MRAKTRDLGYIGEFKKWARVEFEITGPSMAATSGDRNPHRKEVLVIFKGPDRARAQVVPGFFAGNGAGGLSGKIWRVRFSADAVGHWTFTTFSDEPLLDGFHGRFSIRPLDGSEKGFFRLGRLRQFPGKQQFKLDDGSLWIQGGSGDPVNFLGAPFGDASFRFKKSCIDYLASKGINAQRMAVNTIDGTHDDTWPWLGSTPAEAKANHELFDLARLEEWDMLFTHMQEKGVAPQVVLGSREAWTRYDHYLCYRELVARFGHQPALIWDLGEGISGGRTTPLTTIWAGVLRQIDPYQHPIVARVSPADVLGQLKSLDGLGGMNFQVRDDPSLADLNRATLEIGKALEGAGRSIPIIWNPVAADRSVSSRVKFRSSVLWPILMAGGNLNLRFDSRRFSFESLDAFWTDLGWARAMVQRAIDSRMAPANGLVSKGLCLARSLEALLIYLSDDSGNVAVDLKPGPLSAAWIEPATGFRHKLTASRGANSMSFSRPQGAAGGDGILEIRQAQESSLSPASPPSRRGAI